MNRALALAAALLVGRFRLARGAVAEIPGPVGAARRTGRGSATTRRRRARPTAKSISPACGCAPTAAPGARPRARRRRCSAGAPAAARAAAPALPAARRRPGGHRRGRPRRRVARARHGAVPLRSQRPAGRHLLRGRRQHRRRPALHAVGAGHPQRAARRSTPRTTRTRCAFRWASCSSTSSRSRGRSIQTKRDPHRVRGQLRAAPHLPGRAPAAAAGRAAAVLVRLLGGPLGRRHAGGRDQQPARRRGRPLRRLARRERQPLQPAGQVHRALPPPHLRPAAHRHDGRGSEGVHEAVDGARRSAHHCRRGADRVHLQREPAVPPQGQDRRRRRARTSSRPSTLAIFTRQPSGFARNPTGGA